MRTLELDILTEIKLQLHNGMPDRLVPTDRDKKPYHRSWQKRNFTLEQIKAELSAQRAFGYAIKPDAQSLIIDCDGQGAGDLISQSLPWLKEITSPSWTSGKEGRWQMYLALHPSQIEELKKAQVTVRKVVAENGDLLELRFNKCTSTLPPSVHPETGYYRWIHDFSVSPYKVTKKRFQQIIELFKIKPIKSPSRHKKQQDVQFVSSVDQIPLEKCISPIYRELIQTGVAQNSRDNTAIAIAKDLVGTADFLNARNQAFTGSPRDLLWEFCSRCTPPLPESDCERILASAVKSNPSPCLDPDKIQNCINAYFKVGKTTSSKSTSYNSEKRRRMVLEPIPTKDTLNPDATVQKLIKISSTVYPEENNRTIALQDVITKSVLPEKTIYQIIRDLESVALTRNEEENLKKIIESNNANIDIREILPELAEELLHDAENTNSDPAMFVMPLMATVLSLGGLETKLRLNYDIPSNLYSLVVSPVSSGKSRGQRIITAPLWDIDKHFKRQYEEQYEQYENDLAIWEKSRPGDRGKRPKPPKRRRVEFNRATPEAVVKKGGEQYKNGVLWQRDEVLGLFSNLKGYSDNSDGLQSILELWDNVRISVVRVLEEDSFEAEICLSIYGGIQPKTVGQFLSGNNADCGLIGRFVMVRCHRQPLKQQDVLRANLLPTILPDLYYFVLNEFNSTVSPSRECQALINQYRYFLDEEAFRYSEDSIEAGWIQKAINHMLRVALAIHIISCYFQREKDIQVLTPSTAAKAIKVCEWLKSHFLSIVGEFYQKDDGDLGDLLGKIWLKAKQQSDGLTVRAATQGVRGIRELAKDEGFNSPSKFTLHLFRQLEASGKGKLHKEGRTYKITALEPTIVDRVPFERKSQTIDQPLDVSIRIEDEYAVGTEVIIASKCIKAKILERGVTELGDKIAKTDNSDEYYYLVDLIPLTENNARIVQEVRKALVMKQWNLFTQYFKSDAELALYCLESIGEEHPNLYIEALEWLK